MSDPQPTFEDAMKELEDVVTRLETGGLPLEETLALFERGQALVALCNQTLDQAELRLQQARPAEGGITLTPVDSSEE